jgi:hypothetical protein
LYFFSDTDEREAYTKLLEIQARNIIHADRHWQAVCDLAGALLEHGRRLSRQQTKAAIPASYDAQMGRAKLKLPQVWVWWVKANQVRF